MNTTATRTLTISNTGNIALTVSSVSYPSGFSGNFSSGTIAAGGSQAVTVTFAPTAATSYGGNVTVNSDATGGTGILAISGTGTPTGPQIFFGTMGSDAIAAAVDKGNAGGTLIMRLSATGEAIILKFVLNGDGTFSAKARSVHPTTSGTQADDIPSTAASHQSRTFNGTLINGVLSGTVAELGTSFSATVQPPTGSTAAIAGIYNASVPGSSSSETYLIIGSNGQAYALGVTPTGVISGNGTVTADGRVNISTTASSSIAATVDAPNGVVTGTVTAAGVTSNFAGIGAGTARTDRLINLSSRVRVTAGDGSRAVIAGFVITGSTDKQLLVRAVGPGLTGFGVTDALANPKLQLFDSSGKVIAENDDWNNTSDVSATGDRVGAFKLGASSRDSALVVTVAPGAYTAQVTSVSGNGVVLIEVYDAATGAQLSTQQLVNISTRGFVDTGEGQLVAGFVITGNAPKRVLIRGVGPGLTAFSVPGVVADPTLKIYAGSNSTPIAQNDNWGTPQPMSVTQTAATAAEISAASTVVGAFPLAAGSRDSAVIITLMPGNYSAVVSGVGTGTGAGMVEVYQISDL